MLMFLVASWLRLRFLVYRPTDFILDFRDLSCQRSAKTEGDVLEISIGSEAQSNINHPRG
jgi:hypothetical protein